MAPFHNLAVFPAAGILQCCWMLAGHNHLLPRTAIPTTAELVVRGLLNPTVMLIRLQEGKDLVVSPPSRQGAMYGQPLPGL